MAMMRYVLMQHHTTLFFVEMPSTHAYQLSALNLRLHKEMNKLTAEIIPTLPHAVAECDAVDIHDEKVQISSGLEYINQLEAEFSSIKEKSYPLISLLTEIRALQAQLEQWYEEYEEEL